MKTLSYMFHSQPCLKCMSVLQLLEIPDMNLEKYIIFQLSHLKGRYSELMKASKIILPLPQSILI